MDYTDAMPARIHRILALTIPIKLAVVATFTWYAAQAPVTPKPQLADRIVVVKSTHTMTLYAHGKQIRTYQVSLGRASGAKLQQGDNRTPEGQYRIDAHNAHSTAHLSLHISYPNAEDRARAGATHHSPGGDIMIHGLPNGMGYLGALHRATDWTYGCIAVTDAEIEDIYKLVPNNTPIDIQP